MFRHSRLQRWTITLNFLLSCYSSAIGHTAAAPFRTSTCSQQSPCHWFTQLTNGLVLLNTSSPALRERLGAQACTESWAKPRRRGSLQRSNACSSLRHLNRECSSPVRRLQYSMYPNISTFDLTCRLKKKPEDKRKQEGAVRHM